MKFLIVVVFIAFVSVVYTEEAEPVNICELPHTEGTVQCRAAKPRFYFNKDAKKCQFFNYGGCGATANNFKAIEECQKACPGDVEQQTDEKVKPTLESSPAT